MGFISIWGSNLRYIGIYYRKVTPCGIFNLRGIEVITHSSGVRSIRCIVVCRSF